MIYDVVVIGGGLAGLAACQALQDLDVLLLESAAELGGRVVTRHRDGLTYDVGAMIAYDPHHVAIDVSPSDLIREELPIGIYYRNRLARGDTIDDCLDLVCAGRPGLRQTLSAFAHGTLGFRTLPPEARRLVRAAFKTIHPGEIDTYDSAVHGDGLARYYPSHWSGGNQELVEAYVQRIRGPIRCRASATHLTADRETIDISVKDRGRPRTVRGRTVIIATPATIARKLLRRRNPPVFRWLSTVRYARGTVVVVAFGCSIWTDLSYALTPQREMDVLYQQRAPSGRSVCLAYYGTEASRRVSSCSARELTRQVLAALSETGSDVRPQDILFSDVKRWEVGGTILSPALMRATRVSRPSGQPIVLAGDYTWEPYPYGMMAAIQSGAAAARAIRTFLQFRGGGS